MRAVQFGLQVEQAIGQPVLERRRRGLAALLRAALRYACHRLSRRYARTEETRWR